MKNLPLYNILTYFFAAVWLVNGLLCKVLNLVPRHQEIVSRILGAENAFILTKIIGVLEILMAVWIISGINTRLNAISQISIILLMNIIEFMLVPDLLLWGRFNILFALVFVSLIYYKEFILSKNN